MFAGPLDVNRKASIILQYIAPVGCLVLLALCRTAPKSDRRGVSLGNCIFHDCEPFLITFASGGPRGGVNYVTRRLCQSSGSSTLSAYIMSGSASLSVQAVG